MKPSEAFGVVVRSVGLLLVLSGLASLLSVFAAPGVMLVAIPTLLVGFWLLRSARIVVSFAYPDDREADPRMINREDTERIRSAGQTDTTPG